MNCHVQMYTVHALVRDDLSSDVEQELRDAAKRGDVGEVKRLIESGVSVNSQNRVRRLSDCTCTSTCIAYYTCIP